MKAARKIGIILLIMALAIAAGCTAIDGGTDDGTDGGSAYHYVFDEITWGYFGQLVPEMTVNAWCLNVLESKETYDEWTRRENVCLYKDQKLTVPYAGSDIIDENAHFYCDFSFNGLGKRLGRITGTINLFDIPDRGTKVHLVNLGFKDGSMWLSTGKIKMKGTGSFAQDVPWSIPVYETFIPNWTSTFILYVLPEDSMYPYDILHQRTVTIGKPNEDMGHIGDRSIKGVKLSGTITISYNGEPVPYVEIYAHESRDGAFNATSLSYPEAGAQWSVTFGTSSNNHRDVSFRILGYAQHNGTEDDVLFALLANQSATIFFNEDISDIELTMGDAQEANRY